MNNNPPLTGSCLCGAIAYQVNAIGEHITHCHCQMCRKFHGAAFSTFAAAPKDDFLWLKGEHLLASYTAPNQTVRQFCQHCGSSLTFSSAGNTELVEFATGTLDVDLPKQPDSQIFTHYKANWVALHDNLTAYPEGPNE